MAAHCSLLEPVPRCSADKVAAAHSMESNRLCFHSPFVLQLRPFLCNLCVNAHDIKCLVGSRGSVPSRKVCNRGNVAPCGLDDIGHRPHRDKEGE